MVMKDGALSAMPLSAKTAISIRAAGGKAPLAISPVAYPTRRFDTPSGRIEFVSERARAMGLPEGDTSTLEG